MSRWNAELRPAGGGDRDPGAVRFRAWIVEERMSPLKGDFMPSLQGGPPGEVLSFAARRAGATSRLVEQAREIVRACQAMALRFHRRGKLIVFGDGPSASDAEHLMVEFLHPATAGRRVLPAICLAGDSASLSGTAESEGWPEVFASPLRHFARPADIALALSIRREPENVRRALGVARERGLLTVSVVGDPDRPFVPVDHRIVAGSPDPLLAREVQMTAYHLMWELVHAFLEQPGALSRKF